ncbi:hypothetical protein COU18_00615 [Candidatus Kaiserbacteria bacterium CG10_big_fil_rev_8_21_14_0_10_51_14]|uniref:PKD domain-containing protein n=1 Tax=Candidatus Kaiserbacteria bacterium CG10_big_fil_rev_8_21_14_0_10_51_14 TaxID=1974610 RepID=A0A2H0UDP2_9BACT|nr:MAG: hypothetical protein COU18_00615 [Candidatus Kaiserbacteria bacterium CG10_big_fil_rev_8_21_14_0_10_51_14]
MNKLLVSAIIVVASLVGSVASAQVYYPTYPTTYPTNSYLGTCVNLYTDLSYGSKGSEVTQLQTFLVSQNYPGSGSWMITGNFRSATLAAVRNFQQSQGLPITGIVDAATRAAISRMSCGNYGSGYSTYNYNYNTYPSSFAQGYGGTQYTNPFNYNYNYNNTNCLYTYPYTCNNYNTYNTVTVTSLSAVTGLPGTSVTVYGSGFDYSNNTVYFGSIALPNIPSSNGTSLTFTVPVYATAGTVGVYVTNYRGTSNMQNFGVLATYSSCSGVGGYPYTYGYNCPSHSGPISLTYLNPNSGAVGSVVTVIGTGFSSTGNTVNFGNGFITGINSFDGRTLTFTVPSQLSGGSSAFVTSGVYNVSVRNFSNQISNALPFTVTGSSSYGAPAITSVTGPTTLPTNTQGTWTIMIQNNQLNSYVTTAVNWGDQTIFGASLSPVQTTYVQGNQTLTFTHTYTTPGTYTITFTVSNVNGQQNSSTATVVVGQGTGNVTLSSISPMSAHIGTQIMLIGSGFTPLENTVRFGIGGTQHVPSQNGTTIYYTIPSFVSPCDLVTPGSFCGQPVQQVMPGPIQVYVTNSNGTSNTILLQVQ